MPAWRRPLIVCLGSLNFIADQIPACRYRLQNAFQHARFLTAVAKLRLERGRLRPMAFRSLMGRRANGVHFLLQLDDGGSLPIDLQQRPSVGGLKALLSQLRCRMKFI